ncbi:MAG: GTP 3',8-cyclase MoaA [Coraliomargaritaceae bacterium]
MTTDLRGRGLRDLRISLTDRCNLRCTYCMPKEVFGPDYEFLRREQWLRFKELDEIVDAFVGLGVRKIRLTGGEPLLRPGLTKYIRGLSRFYGRVDLAMTTNGLRLAEKAGELREAGLNRVTVSVDALDPEIYAAMNGKGVAPALALAGIEAAMDAGFEVKVNMVVERGVNDGEILPMARYFKERGVILRFIEFMDVGNCNGWNMDRVLFGKDILQLIQSEFSVEAIDESSSQEVAKRYRYTEDGVEFGLITSVTQPFCAGCTRARISADGKLYTCLFATSGFDLKGFLHSPEYNHEALNDLLLRLWAAREDRYSELRTEASKDLQNKVEMSYIGG